MAFNSKFIDCKGSKIILNVKKVIKWKHFYSWVKMHLTSLHIMVKGDQIIIFSAALGSTWSALKAIKKVTWDECNLDFGP